MNFTDLDVNAILEYVLSFIEPKINPLLGASLVPITQVIKVWFFKKWRGKKLMIIPLMLSICLTIAHVFLDGLVGFSIITTPGIYFLIAIGTYAACRKFGILKSNYQRNGGDRRGK